jgi:ABC-2 type transport system permease protein
MNKILIIGFKDFKIALRDRAGLILMLLAPFLLTLGLGAVTGRFSGGSAQGISDIPIIVINQDGKQLGNALVAAFQSKDLQQLIVPTVSTDPVAAYQQVDNNQAVAVVLIPAGFTDSIIPPQGQNDPGSPVQIELYANQTAPTIVDEFISQVEVGRVSGQVAVAQLLDSGRVQVQQAQAIGEEIGSSQASAAGISTAISLNNVTQSGIAVQFDVLAVLAPGMALMFLMYTVSNGGRTILTERSNGTLPRLLVSPTTAAQVLGGKMVGIFLTGVVQMLILIVSMSVLFGVQWGDQNGIFLLVLSAVFAAVGWGMLITAIARTPGQVSMAGTAIMLTFGILGGTFVNIDAMPTWFRYITKVTPNAWGIDGFNTLAQGGGLQDVLTPIIALIIMGLILFFIALLLFNRRGLTER